MSDISKKILSIDPDEGDFLNESTARSASNRPGEETFPSFVHRPTPLSSPSTDQKGEGRWVIWTGVLLAILWIGLSVAFLLLLPKESVDIFNPINLTLITLIILFPALLIILFCGASHKLSRMSMDSARLSNISERLLQADQTSAHQATNLAGTIRAQMNQLDEEMSALTARFKTARDTAQTHSKTLTETSSSLLSANQTLEDSIKAQRDSLATMMKTADEKFQQTEEKLETQKTSLTETLDRTALSLNEAGQKLEDKSHAFDSFISESETRLSSMSEKLSDAEQKSESMIENLTEQIEGLTQKISDLEAQNTRLSETIETQLPMLSSLTESADAAKEELFGVISKSVDATDALRSEAKSVGELLSEKFQSLNTELSLAQQTTRDIIESGNSSTSIAAERSKQIKGRQIADPGNRDFEGSPQDQTKTQKSEDRLHLRPLEEDKPLPEAAPKSYDLEIEPLELDTDMSIPSPEREAPAKPQPDPDVVKPLTEPAPLFGRAKPKEKSPWRWRDMMGGFDSPDKEDEPEQNLTVENETPLETETPPHTLRDWINKSGIDVQTIDNGTLLEVANAMSMKSETASSVLWRRAPGLAGEVSVAVKEHDGFREAAHLYREELSDTINPEIMNRDALRNRLNTPDGRLYLLSLLA